MNKKGIEGILYSYPFLTVENKNIKLEIERLEVVGFKNISYDFKPKSNQMSSIVETEVINRDKEIEKLNARYINNEITMKKVENALEVLNENQREIIKRIYFKRCMNKDIAQQLYLTHNYVSELKKQALSKLETMLF